MKTGMAACTFKHTHAFVYIYVLYMYTNVCTQVAALMAKKRGTASTSTTPLHSARSRDEGGALAIEGPQEDGGVPAAGDIEVHGAQLGLLEGTLPLTYASDHTPRLRCTATSWRCWRGARTSIPTPNHSPNPNHGPNPKDTDADAVSPREGDETARSEGSQGSKLSGLAKVCIVYHICMLLNVASKLSGLVQVPGLLTMAMHAQMCCGMWAHVHMMDVHLSVAKVSALMAKRKGGSRPGTPSATPLSTARSTASQDMALALVAVPEGGGRQCRACGNTLMDDSEFCRKCGTKCEDRGHPEAEGRQPSTRQEEGEEGEAPPREPPRMAAGPAGFTPLRVCFDHEGPLGLNISLDDLEHVIVCGQGGKDSEVEAKSMAGT